MNDEYIIFNLKCKFHSYKNSLGSEEVHVHQHLLILTDTIREDITEHRLMVMKHKTFMHSGENVIFMMSKVCQHR